MGYRRCADVNIVAIVNSVKKKKKKNAKKCGFSWVLGFS
jgi:hypothetical protein